MYTTVQKWGNSHAVRLPKGIMEAAALSENDRVEIDLENDRIIIRRVKNKHKTLEQRLTGYRGDYQCSEWESGNPRGNEVW